MKISFSHQLLDLEGNDLMLRENTPLTLKAVCIEALLSSPPNVRESENISGEEKFRRFKIATAISDSKPDGLEISVEDVALLKQLIGKIFLPLVVGRSFEFLEAAQTSSQINDSAYNQQTSD